MGHRGKHIIDPETGLCEICDKGALEEVHQGKRPGKQVFYSNHDDGSTYRSNNTEIPDTKDRHVYEIDDEPKVRRVRKTVYPQPTVRPRRVVYEAPVEEPVVVRRKIVRRERTPPEEVIVHRPPPPRPTTFYYVDQDNQLVPQNRPPPPEPPRRYIVQSKNSPPTRTVRVIRRQTQTPPPPSSEMSHSGPRRKINSDTEILERQQRMRRNDMHYTPPLSIKPEMYHIQTNPNHIRRSPLESPVYMSRDNITPPPPPPPSKVIYQGNHNRKPTRVEPFERPNHHPPEPTVVRRVYKKLPPGRTEPPADEFISNENYPRTVRRTGKNLPPPKHYQSAPEFKNRNYESTKSPSIFYIRNPNEYE